MADEASMIADGQFQIPEQCYPKFEAAIAKLSKKSIKLGGEAFTPIVFGYEMIPGKHAGAEVKVFNVLLGGTVPVVNGWEFVAKIDHANKDLGNIVRALPGKTLPERFRKGECKCEHCNIKRFRRDTFILHNVLADEHKQVGRTCLKDFLGHENPENVAKMAELLSYAYEVARGFRDEQGGDRRYLNLEDYLTHVTAAVRAKGYFVSKSTANDNPGLLSTAFVALNSLMGGYDAVLFLEDADREMAVKSIEWAQAIGDDGSTLNDYQHNIKLLAASGAIEFRSSGYAASIVGGYLRSISEPHVKAEKKTSNYVGVVDQKLEVTNATLKHTAETNGRFPGFMYLFEDESGNVVKWFTTKNIQKERGTSVSFVCKVKGHDEYKGVKSTTVSNVTIK